MRARSVKWPQVTPERWAKLEDLFHETRALVPAERDAFLAAACAGDSGMRREIESLLVQQEGALLEQGIGVAAAGLVTSAARGNHEGRAFGPYVLGALIGSGGMGDVYRARDERLGRDVAVKVLPHSLAQHPDRFEREARILASLNHPHIGAIHGIEESDGIRGLVLELVDGVTLSERIAAGAVPLEEALVIARQIADALGAAHQKGIVHRDLKPANIKITPANVVKVLDFGLAKIVAPDSEPAALPVMGTADGVILGTVAYMSPEQARGLTVDKRADIWAFGCVLYEMLTGARAFTGASSADVLGAIVSTDPDWTALPAATPRRVRDMLRRCLAKNPERRLHDIADARIEIEDAIGGEVEADAGQRAQKTRSLLPWIMSGVAIAAVALAIWFAAAARTPAPAIARVAIELPADVAIYAIGRGSSVAVSPDGQRIVFVGIVGGRTQLYLRPLNSATSSPMAGTEGATNPVFSPDGRWIGFVEDGRLKKIPVDGGPPFTIVHSAPDSAQRLVVQAASWAAADTIVFSAVSQKLRGLWRVPAAGGDPERVSTPRPGELNHVWPQFLPEQNAVIFTIWNNTNFDGGRVVVRSLAGGEPAVLVDGASYGRVVIDGRRRAWLVYARPEGLQAAPFDLQRLQLTGPAVPVQDGVLTNLSGGAHFSVSDSGLLAYVPGGLDEADKTAFWVDRSGVATEIGVIPGLGFQYRISPDGRWLVRPNATGNRDLWIDDLSGRAPPRRLTFSGTHNLPMWTPDGKRIIYTLDAPGANINIFWRSADGSADEERLTTSPNVQIPRSVSPDGATLAYQETTAEGGPDIWVMPLREPRRPRLLLGTPSAELNPMFSPDGRWIAYSSTQSGMSEVYLMSFPDGGHRTAVSKGGGFNARWAADGRELYYRTRLSEQGDGNMMAVSIDTTGPVAKIGTPRVLFATPYQGDFDVTPDGRFLLLKRTAQESPSRVVHLVLNWFEHLHAKTAPRSFSDP
jgi:Tol biopolymer transport system component